MTTASCYTIAELEAFVIDGERDSGVRDHLASCTGCRERLVTVRSNNAFLSEFRSLDQLGEPPVPDELEQVAGTIRQATGLKVSVFP